MHRFLRIFLQIIGGATLCLTLTAVALLAFAGQWMKVNESPVESDYILPLAGDTHRFIKGAELFREGYAPIILLSKARGHPPSRLQKLHWKMGYPKYSTNKYLTLLLRLLNAESAQLEPFGHGHISTVEEAEALRDHLDGKRVRLLIVTSPYHARRAKMIYEDTLPGCTVTVVSTEEGAFKEKWWRDQESAQNLIMEFAKTMHYLLGGAFRSTDPVPGDQSDSSLPASSGASDEEPTSRAWAGYLSAHSSRVRLASLAYEAFPNSENSLSKNPYFSANSLNTRLTPSMLTTPMTSMTRTLSSARAGANTSRSLLSVKTVYPAFSSR